jgi:hypothetical protein
MQCLLAASLRQCMRPVRREHGLDCLDRDGLVCRPTEGLTIPHGRFSCVSCRLHCPHVLVAVCIVCSNINMWLSVAGVIKGVRLKNMCA